MQSMILLGATLLASATFCVHTFVGSPRVASPLFTTKGLPFVSKWLNYFCWHAVTVVLFFLIPAYGWLAYAPNLPFLMFLTVLCGAISILSAAVERMAGLRPLIFPSTSFLGGLALLGLAALIVG